MSTRKPLYATTDVPTTQTTVYTSTARTHIDAATAYNDTGGAVSLLIELGGIPVYSGNIPDSTPTVISAIINHALDAGETIQVTAGASDLNLLVSGRDF